MTNTLRTRLQLVDGDRVRDSLRQIGADGRAAFEALTRGAQGPNPHLRALSEAIRQTRERLREARQAFADFRDEAGRLGTAVQHTGRQVRRLATAALAGLAAIVALSHGATAAADEHAKAAERAGVTVGQYGRLAHAAEQSGVEVGALQSAFTRLNRTYDQALRGGQAQTALFRRLGVDIDEARRRGADTHTIFRVMAELFSRMEDGAEKAALATAFFGQSGAQLIPLLNLGAAGIDALGDDAERLGIVFTEQQAAIGTAYQDAWHRAGRAIAGVRYQLGLLFAPALTEAFGRFTELVIENRDLLVDWAGRGWAAVLRSVEDLIHAFTGEDARVSQRWVLDLRDGTLATAEAFRAAFADIILPALRTFRDLLQECAELVNVLFDTELTGDQLAVVLVVGQLLGLFGLLVGLLRTVGAGIKAVGAAIAVLKPAVVALGAFFTSAGGAALTMFGPQGLIAVAVIASLAIWWAFRDQLTALLMALWELVRTVFTGIADSMRGALSGTFDWIGRQFDRIVDGARALGRQVAGLFGFAGGGPAGRPDGISGYAGGGRVRGPGSGTSDSVLARLSNGEFVVRAAAVRHYGLGLLDRLNRMQLPRFGEGGLAGGLTRGLTDGLARALAMPGLLPAFAAGGPVEAPAAGRPVNLTLDGRGYALQASDDVAEALIRAARVRAARRVGRAPRWAGGGR